MYSSVADFHRRFGLFPLEEAPALLTNKEQLYRLARMLEELHEFQKAHLTGDLVKAADSLADLVYFAMGTAFLMGLPFENIFMAVHEANMHKIRVEEAGASKYGDGKDIVKPEGWRSPEEMIARFLRDYGYDPAK